MKSPEPSTEHVARRFPALPNKRRTAVSVEEAESRTAIRTDLNRLAMSERKNRIKIGAAASTLDLVIKYQEIMLKEVDATGADTVMSGLSDDIRDVADMLFELKESLLERDETATRAINQILTAT